MAIKIYTKKEVVKIYDSGMIAFETHMMLVKHLRPGISTMALDKIATDFIRSKGCEPSFLGYGGFPACLCTSINDGVVHGVPKEDEILKEGDIIGIDLGVIRDGYYSDTAWTWPIGQVSDADRSLIETTQKCLYKGLNEARATNRIGAIGEVVQKHAEANGCSVVRELVGHGVGSSVHEEPQVPNYGKKKNGPKIRSGMVLAIEPMVCAKSHQVYTDKDDKWTVRTKDGAKSAHFEHTVAVTADGPMICTMPKGSKINVFELTQDLIKV